MHASMPPDTSPPDDARGSDPGDGGNVVDPEVLAERRAQRAEQAEHSAARRAADAQVLAAQLARERAQLAAERDAARAEAAAAREGADAAIAEAAHVQAERDTLRDALTRAHAERDALRAEREAPADAAPGEGEPQGDGNAVALEGNDAARNGHGTAPPPAWHAALRRELTVARTVTAAPSPLPPVAPLEPMSALARERRIAARRAASPPATAGASLAQPRRGDRAAPVTALTLERERSSRLQAQLDHSLAVQQELRLQVAALERAVRERVDAEQRIETALRRVREELSAVHAIAAPEMAPPAVASEAVAAGLPRAPAGTAAPATAAPVPAAATASPPDLDTPDAAAPATKPAPAPEPPEPGLGLDPLRLSAARERLRAAAPADPVVSARQPAAPLREGPVAPWLAPALQRLLEREPATAGRLAIGLLPAQALFAQRPLRYDLRLEGWGTVSVDLEPGVATVSSRSVPRERGVTDVRIATDHVGAARLLFGRRRRLRRTARVRGSRRALRELRRLARAPYGIRDLANVGVTLDPLLALRLVALAVDPQATRGERFAIAHGPHAGGPVDAWLRIADGEEPMALDAAPPEPVRLTLRCTRGALLPLLAGAELPPGESGTIDGDEAALGLLRGWIAATEHPAA